MKKAAREAIKLAAREGGERPWLEGGDPHPRLHGTVAGRPFKIVTNVSSKASADRWPLVLRQNIRREVRRIREGIGA